MKPRKVLAYRKDSNLTQKEVADVLGISVDAYSKKERGVNEFKENEMIKFAKLINKKDKNATIEKIFFWVKCYVFYVIKGVIQMNINNLHDLILLLTIICIALGVGYTRGQSNSWRDWLNGFFE